MRVERSETWFESSWAHQRLGKCTLRVALTRMVLTRLALEIESGRLDPRNARDLHEANRRALGF
ncbi:MAG TPA: hypothetical protein PKL14_10345 [Holophaga sp.]|nr:hypothetical protein [Holophaga sp.]